MHIRTVVTNTAKAAVGKGLVMLGTLVAKHMPTPEEWVRMTRESKSEE